MQVCVCWSMCVGGDDDLLLLATEVGVVQTSVIGGNAQVIAPRASDGSSGKDATGAELQAMGVPHVIPILFLHTHHAHFESMSTLCDIVIILHMHTYTHT